MALEDYVRIAEELAPVVSELTGKPFDAGDVTFIVGEGDFNTSAAIERVKAICIRPNSQYNLPDIAEQYLRPDALITVVLNGLLGGVIKRKMAESLVMAYLGEDDAGEHCIAVNPKFLDASDTEIRRTMSHELVHAADDIAHGLYSSMEPVAERVASTEEELISLRRSLGLVKGYIRPTEEVLDLKARVKEGNAELERCGAVAESHAEYISAMYQDSVDLPPPSEEEMKKQLAALLATLPLFLIPSYRRKIMGYFKGQELVAAMYASGQDIGLLFSDVPSEDEFHLPELYFERHGLEYTEPDFNPMERMMRNSPFARLGQGQGQEKEQPPFSATLDRKSRKVTFTIS